MTERETLEKYNRMYRMSLVQNKQLIIDSFVEYYGEEYRDIITARYNKLIFTWTVDHRTSEFAENWVLSGLMLDCQSISSEILKCLGVDLSHFTIDIKQYPKITGEYENVGFTGGRYDVVNNDNDENVTSYLKDVFGDDIFYSFDNENTPLYNFEKLDFESQKQFLRRVLKREEITDEDFSNVRKAIAYINSLSEKKKEILETCRDYIDVYRSYTYYKSVSGKKDKYVPRRENIVGTTNPKVLRDLGLLCLVLSHTRSNFAADTVVLGKDEGVSVVFPTIITSDETIIHEIGHGLVSIPLIFSRKVKVANSGTALMTNNNDIIGGNREYNKRLNIEELLNDLAAYEITDTFHKKGGTISLFDEKLIPIGKDYSIYFPLIRSFYEKYKDLIKEARITGSRNLLVNTIGEEKYEEFSRLLTQLETKLDMQAILHSNGVVSTIHVEDYYALYSPEDLDKINALVESMPDPVSKEERKAREQEELNEMMQRLTGEGRKVTLLNPTDESKSK